MWSDINVFDDKYFLARRNGHFDMVELLQTKYVATDDCCNEFETIHLVRFPDGTTDEVETEDLYKLKSMHDTIFYEEEGYTEADYHEWVLDDIAHQNGCKLEDYKERPTSFYYDYSDHKFHTN